MKKLFTLTFILFSFFAKADYWTQKADFGGIASDYPFSFSIGNKGYVGLHYSTGNFWEYNPSTNTWTQKADYGGLPRYVASGFSIMNKGYVGLGAYFNGSGFGYLNDFWEYDPLTNIWTQKANFGGGNRNVAVGFSIGNMGYVGTGWDGTISHNDLWQYDPILDTWVQKSNLPLARAKANSFVIGSNGYVLAGDYTALFNDLWEYNSLADYWSQKANLPASPRQYAAAFSICDKGYFGTGWDTSFSYLNDFWQYNPVTNAWIQKANFQGASRAGTVHFSIANKGYIGLGGFNSGVFHDFWEYTPDSACATGIEELPISNLDFTISPNPAKDYLIISYPLSVKENIYITITDAQGKKVYEAKVLTSHFRLPTSDFQKGIYFVEATNGKQKAIKKFVKE